MDAGTALVVAAIALLALAVTVATLRTPAAARRARIAVLRADLALRRARASHDRLVRAAEREVARVERRHSTELAELDRRIVALEDPRGPRLDTFGPIALHALRLVTPSGDVPVDGVRADVDAEGSISVRRRTTLTRLAVGGALLGPLGAVLALGFPKRRTVDGRELYLIVEAGPASCVLQVDPDDGVRVRTFAARINGAAATAAQRRVDLTDELAATRRRLAEMREDHSALDAAREGLAAARIDVAALARVASATERASAARAELARLIDAD